jgi:hypothetical protein
MDADKSLEIINALTNGVDPHTGEEYSNDSPYQHPQTKEALLTAIQALERTKKAENRQRQLPRNAGKVWEDEEDQRLLIAFDAGSTIWQLAEKHERTEGSISARLAKHGKVLL